jgi:predicted permease
VSGIPQDARQAWRSLRGRWIASLAIVSVVGLAIAINSTVFSVVSAVLLRPLPYPQPERLVRLWFGEPHDPTGGAFPRDIDHWRRTTEALEGIAAYRSGVRTWADEAGRGRGILVAEVSAAFFDVLRTHPTAGRGFRREEESPDAPPVAVVGTGLWNGGADEIAAGPSIVLDGIRHRVVGVMPASFGFPGGSTRAWVPLRKLREPSAGRGEVFVSIRTVLAIGRLAEGVGLARARTEALAIFAGSSHRSRPQVASMREADARSVRSALVVLQMAVLLVLMIGAVNVAHLLLARSVERRPEFAVRTALGASRYRIVRQWAMEGLLLAASGGVLGLLLTAWGIGWLRSAAPPAVGRREEIILDPGVILFCACATVAVAVLTVVVPAVHTLRVRPEELDLCRKSLGSPLAARQRGRRVLIAAQFALALALLVTANAVVRSFLNIVAIDSGFDAAGVAAGEMRLPGVRYEDFKARTALLTDVLELAEGVGLRATALASSFPLDGLESFDFSIPGRDRLFAYRQAVSDGYFRTLGISLIRGRAFDPADTMGGRPVVIVSRAFASRFLAGTDPLARSIVRSGRAWDVVGVAEDVRGGKLTGPPVRVVYFSFRQLGHDRVSQVSGLRRVVLFTRVDRDPADRLSVLARRLQLLDPALTIDDVAPLDDRLGRAIVVPRFYAAAMAVFSAIAVLLAGLGVSALIGYAVARRIPEFGLRLALGATRRDIYFAIARLVAVPMVCGAAVGTLGSFWLTRGFRDVLFGVSLFDVVPVAGSMAILVLCGLLACAPSARRAVSIDPAVVLRQP